MKRVRILLMMFIFIITLSSCKSKQLDFYECVQDSACVEYSILANSNPNNEIIELVNIAIRSEMEVNLLTTETLIDYEGYEAEDSKLFINVYQSKDSDQSFDVNKFNEAFIKIKNRLSINGANFDYIKIDFKTFSSFETRSIYLDSNVYGFRSMLVQTKNYIDLTVLEQASIKEDMSYFNLFNKVSYDFMNVDTSYLFDYDNDVPNEIELLIVHRHPEDTFVIPYDNIHTYFTDLLENMYTVILDTEE